MIPVKLTIEGLYSYREEQVIDFRQLTEAGLFGIFGSVGSGKSSILEAISYVLYDRTERLSKGDKRSYNMMNLRSDRLYIEFDFYTLNDELYRATKEIKRHSKRFEEVKTPTTTFYHKKEGEWKALEHTDAEKILGLSYENFKRTIIIPQGQFKEFIELGPKDRTQMMMEIFDLHRFDLQDSTARLQRSNRTELDTINGKLSAYDSISDENILQIREKLIAEEADMARQAEIHRKINRDFLIFQNLYSDWQQLQSEEKLLNELTEQKPSIDQLRHQILEYEAAYKAFFHLLKNEASIQAELHKINAEKAGLSSKLEVSSRHFEENKAKLTNLQALYSGIEAEKIKVSDLRIIANLKECEIKISLSKENREKGNRLFREIETKTQKIEQNIKSLQEEVEKYKNQKIDTRVLMELESWYQKKNVLYQQKSQQIELSKDLQDGIAANLLTLEEMGVTPGKLESYFDNQNNALLDEKTSLQSRLAHLHTESRLAEYADSLIDGHPCPLCGSLHHPHVRQDHDPSAEIEDIRQKLEALEQKLTKLQNNKIKAELITKEITSSQTQLGALEVTIHTMEEEELRLTESFTWQEYDPDNMETFNIRKAALIATEENIRKLEDELLLKRSEIDASRQTLERYRSRLNQLDAEVITLQATFHEKESQLQTLRYADFQQTDKDTIYAQSEKLNQEIAELERNFKACEKRAGELSTQLAAESATLQAAESRHREVEKQLMSLQDDLQKAIREGEYSSREEVDRILATPLDVESNRQKVEDFNIRFEALKKNTESLRDKLKEVTIDEGLKAQKESELEHSSKKLSEITSAVALTRSDLERSSQLLKEKKELLLQQSKLQTREDNLKTIFNLMKGSGFVQYISNVYLRQLCDHANVRFHRMTRGQLSLQLSDSGDFEVTDYLNEGRSRSVKTLSGGQGFQVALSLALALAESVQNHSRSRQNFFFIDEGFGTQDAESVNIVFDTLTGLRKENRIVGIISHVEELKERIPVSLFITRSEEKSSLIALER